MLKVEMARFYAAQSNELNVIITEVENHYNKMVEVVSKLEEKSKEFNDKFAYVYSQIREVSDRDSIGICVIKKTIDELMERITKLESCFTDSVKNLDWIVKEKKLDDDFEKEMRKVHEEYDQKLTDVIGSYNIPYQKDLHHRSIEDLHKQIAELQDETHKLKQESADFKALLDSAVKELEQLREEKKKLKEEKQQMIQDIEKLVSVVHNKLYGGAK